MTEQELNALVGLKRFDLEQADSHMGSASMSQEDYGDWVRYDDASSAITTLRAQLAEARVELVRRVDMHECAMAERDDATLYGAEQKARADRAEFNAAQLAVMVGEDAVEQIEAAVAAQIEADVEIAAAETAMPPQHDIKDQWRSNIGDDVAAAIRAQPHSRTALDAAIRAAKVEALKKAADLPKRTEKLGGQNYAYVRVEEILALIEREGM